MGFIFVVGLALVPTLFYILLVWWLDRYEKEPVSLLVLAFVWGAVPTIILSLIAEIASSEPLYAIDETVGDLISTVITGPFIEEGFKALILFTLFMAFRREFDDVLDGIIYGAMVGLGFAFIENVLYGMTAADEGGLAGVTRAGRVALGHFRPEPQHVHQCDRGGAGLCPQREGPAPHRGPRRSASWARGRCMPPITA